MNNGFFNFPNVSDSNLLDIKEFDSSGSYSIPQGTRLIQIIAIAAGSGGGSGRVRSTGAAFGGGGGAGGSTLIYTFLREQIPTSTLLVLIGAGGLGGVARSASAAQNGASGTAGGQTRIYVREGGVAIPGTSLSITELNGLLLNVPSGAAGSAGTSANGTGGAGRPIFSNGSFSGLNQAIGFGSSGTVSITSTLTTVYNRGGAAGSGNNLVALQGGSIAISSTPSFLNPDLPSGTLLQGSAADSTADAPSSVGYLMMPYMGGMGGAGGGSSVNGNISLGGGGNGWRGGGGGGGGANVVAGSSPIGTSGKGGNGGNGYAAIFCYK